MNIFRQLRWQLTLSYTLVTVSAFLVIVLVLGGILFTQVFLSENNFNPEQMIDGYMNNTIPSNYPMWGKILSQSPVDMELAQEFLKGPESSISGGDLFRIGALQFSVRTLASIRVLVFDPDGILLATSDQDITLNLFGKGIEIGKSMDPTLIPGLEEPFKAALAGTTDPKRLYTETVPKQQYVMAAPVFYRASGKENRLVGVMVVLFDAVPTQKDIPAHILKVAGRSLSIFLIGVGLMGALFGTFFAHRLAGRFKKISATTDLWSAGDFSQYINDTTGDEIAQFSQRLNNMAEQLQSLLRRRQDMAVSEERNRLARDLHDSAKQQALAASLELGTALTLYERDPGGAKEHLEEADALVDAVRKELTNLVHELRPQDMDGQDFSETLKEYAMEWAQRSGIELNFNFKGNRDLPLETREALFRIAQEALANVARHSSASNVDIFLEYETNSATMVVKDDGRGFDTHASQRGVGLASMHERAEALGGSLTVESAPGQGTKIRVTFLVAEERR
jgi:two-component system, NarL family, sensor histidine kinase LiaS